MRTLIAVPCMDSVPALFAQNLAMIRKVDETAVAFQIGSLVYTSRNNLAQKALQMEADYVLWLDSDMTFTPDLMERMFKTLKEGDMDILTGLYFRRVPPYTPTLFDKLEMRGEICSWSQFDHIPAEPFEVGGCGFGCVLMKTDVFFDVQIKMGNFFAPIGNVGEDLAFCWRARQCGYKIFCDPRIICGHVGHIVVDNKFYESYVAQRIQKNGDQ